MGETRQNINLFENRNKKHDYQNYAIHNFLYKFLWKIYKC